MIEEKNLKLAWEWGANEHYFVTRADPEIFLNNSINMLTEERY